MTTTYQSSFPPPHDTKVHTVRPLTQTQPSTLGMHFALGSKAKMALTNSISRLNSKFHMPTFSSGTYSGVIQNQSTWSGSEQCVWVVVLLVGVVLLYGNRVALPLALAELEVPEVRDWVLYRKGMVLGTFYSGYLFGPSLGYSLSNRYGGELVQVVSAVVWSLGNFFTVYLTASSHNVLLFLFRFLTGMAQGAHFPALLSILSRRSPEKKRMFLFSAIITGSHIGSISMGFMSALSTRWNLLSFLMAILGVCWAFLVRTMYHHSARNHKTHYKLSESIHKDSGSGIGINGTVQVGMALGGGRERLKVEVQPLTSGSMSSLKWEMMMSSPPIISLFGAHFSLSLFLHTSMSWLPTYWTSTFLLKHNDILIWLCLVLPWIAMLISSATTIWLCHWLTSQGVDVTTTRKTFTCLSLGGSAFFLLVLAMCTLCGHTDVQVTLALVTLACLCQGFSTGGPLLNPMDLAPSFSGVLFSAMDTVGATAGILGVCMTGFILHSLGSSLLVFLLSAVSNLIALVLYVAFGSGHRLQFDAR